MIGFWQPWLKLIQTYIIWKLLEGEELPKQYDEEKEKLREWFEAEVKANKRKE